MPLLCWWPTPGLVLLTYVVLAVGNPLGYAQSVTLGIVSTPHRTVAEVVGRQALRQFRVAFRIHGPQPAACGRAARHVQHGDIYPGCPNRLRVLAHEDAVVDPISGRIPVREEEGSHWLAGSHSAL